ncbi:MAG: fimbrillin family protein [Muribaculum sp.]|nr:fimbrillin family protein [Muribaculum sp.]
MKKLLFAGIAVSMLAACSNDEVVPVNNESNAIKFGVTTENGTRAADIYCSYNVFKDFTVYAKVDDKFYIKGDKIENKNGGWENVTGKRFWPDNNTVTFYGFHNDNKTFEWDDAKNAPKFVKFTVNSNVANVVSKDEEDNEVTTPGQVDLMYAVKSQSKTTGESVKLNFRHALSQIVFNAKNTNKNFYVEIEEVAVKNVFGEGTYTFPTGDTDSHFDHPSSFGNATGYNCGSWVLSSNTNDTEYRVGVRSNVPDKNYAKIVGDGDLVDLTTHTDTPVTDENGETVGTKHGDFSKAMLLIPSKKDVKTSTGETSNVISDYPPNLTLTTAPHFLVKCRIYNLSDGNANDLSDNYVHWGDTKDDGTVEAKDVLIPFDPNWVEGHKYTYTFIFGQGNGGYDPETEKPVLFDIKWSVDIDEFIKAEDQDKEVNTK